MSVWVDPGLLLATLQIDDDIRQTVSELVKQIDIRNDSLFSRVCQRNSEVCFAGSFIGNCKLVSQALPEGRYAERWTRKTGPFAKVAPT